MFKPCFKVSVLVFGIVMPSGHAGRYQHFGGTYYLAVEEDKLNESYQQNCVQYSCLNSESNSQLEIFLFAHILQFLLLISKLMQGLRCHTREDSTPF